MILITSGKGMDCQYGRGLFGALPGAGATMGTVTNIQVGASSPLSGVTRALMLALVVLVAGG